MVDAEGRRRIPVFRCLCGRDDCRPFCLQPVQTNVYDDSPDENYLVAGKRGIGNQMAERQGMFVREQT